MSEKQLEPVNPGAGTANDECSPTFELPPSHTVRWVSRRKAAVLDAVRKGVLTEEEACRRYQLSAEELSAWRRDIDRYGVGGLRATRFQIYRDTDAMRALKLVAATPRQPTAEARSNTLIYIGGR